MGLLLGLEVVKEIMGMISMKPYLEVLAFG